MLIALEVNCAWHIATALGGIVKEVPPIIEDTWGPEKTIESSRGLS